MEYIYIDRSDAGQSDRELAMAEIPMQQWRQLYEPETGFDKGTVFRELDKPFCGREVCAK